jgi:hypothetical protein
MSTVRRLSAVCRRGLMCPVLAGTAVAALVVMVGCGAAAGTASAPTPSIVPATPTAIPTPAPTPDLTASAAAAYLAAAKPLNAATAALNRTACGASTYTQSVAKNCWPKYVVLDQAFLTAVFGIKFPASMKSDADSLITALTKVVADDRALAANYLDPAGAELRPDSAAELAAANIVRHDLGLPQVSA